MNLDHTRNGKGRPVIAQEKYTRQVMAFCGVMALLVIPSYTIQYATQDSLIHSNMSTIGGQPGQYLGLVLWGGLCTVYLHAAFTFLFDISRYQNRTVRAMMHIACTLLLLTAVTPFVPEQMPRAASFHNAFAIGASLSVIAVAICFVRHLAQWGDDVYRKAHGTLGVVIGVCALVLMATGISGLVEVLFIVSMCLFLFNLMRWLRKRVEETGE